MIYEREFSVYGFDDIVAYSGNDITDEMLDESFLVSESFFKDKYQIKDSKIRSILRKNGKLFFIIFDREEKKVIGYSFWLPIKNEIFLNFVKEEKTELFMEEEYIADPDDKIINLFSVGEAFVPGYDLDNLHKGLEDIIQKKILGLAEKGTKVNYVAIEAVCDYDKSYMAKILGTDKIREKKDSVLMFGKYSPQKSFSRSKYSRELIKFYK